MNRLQTKFLGVDFKNPIVTSSGCFGFGLEYRDYFDPNVLGGIVVKGLTMEPRDGNYGTRIAETPGGMLNCVGLENPGIDYFETHILKDMKEAGIIDPAKVEIVALENAASVAGVLLTSGCVIVDNDSNKQNMLY